MLCLLTAGVFLFGGVRDHFAGVLISVRSWQRPAAFVLLLVALRHAYQRTPVMPAVWADRIAAGWRASVGSEVAPVFFSSRLVVLLVGYLAVVTVGVPPSLERFRVSDNQFENLVARWDVSWYVSIITTGYQWDGNPAHQQNVVFFPAFPAVMHAVGLFVGKRWMLAGLLAALGAFFVALAYLYRLARELIDEDGARVTIWALAAYPFSAYYSVPYTESLYLLCAVAAFYEATRARWWRAAVFGYAVALCRPNGFLIALPLAILVARQAIREGRIRRAAMAPLVAPVAGILSYCAFLYLRFGDPLVWSKGQSAWGRAYVGIWQGAAALWLDRYHAIAQGGFYQYSATRPYDLLYTVAAIFVLVSVVPTIRRFGLAYGLFTLVNILPPLLVGGMMSIGRMTSVLFPAFLWLGAAVPKRYAPALIACFCMLQGLVAILFFTWRPIF